MSEGKPKRRLIYWLVALALVMVGLWARMLWTSTMSRDDAVVWFLGVVLGVPVVLAAFLPPAYAYLRSHESRPEYGEKLFAGFARGQCFPPLPLWSWRDGGGYIICYEKMIVFKVWRYEYHLPYQYLLVEPAVLTAESELFSEWTFKLPESDQSTLRTILIHPYKVHAFNRAVEAAGRTPNQSVEVIEQGLRDIREGRTTAVKEVREKFNLPE